MKLVRRRTLLQAAIAAIAGVVTLLVGGAVAAFFAGVWRKRQTRQWIKVCNLDQLNSMEPTHFRVAFKFDHLDGELEDVRGVYAILTDKGPLVFSTVCTHMHCAVRWIAWRQQITCPCHGGFYDRWGQLIGGPPPFSLPVYETQVRGDEVFIANAFVARNYV
ncbi:MAG: ubiquinol-cytochrome c reductase iron-sulfur subunit [Myxococcales bacterium]|jgi:Rieske Fe-S protein